MSEAAGEHRYEILEHTADIGLRAQGATLEELFENAAWGLAEILDAARAPRGYAPRPQRVQLAATDVEALLVDWLNEIIVLTEEGKACIADSRIEAARADVLEAEVELVDCDPPPEGTDLKAATYHQLSIRHGDDGWVATVFFDV